MLNPKRTAALVLVVLLSVPVAASAQEEEPKTLTVGQMVFVDVFRHPDLSTTAEIDSSGTILLEHIGAVKVSGMTEDEASAAVTKAFLKILKTPRVRVTRGPLGVPSGFRTAEMHTEIIPLQNADAETLCETLRSVSTQGGAVTFDPKTNTLVVTDTPEALKNIMSVANRLDQMRSQLIQVRIESKIAEVKAGAMKELGVRWFVREAQMTSGYYPLGPQDHRITGLSSQSAPLQNETVGGTDESESFGASRRFIDEVFDRRLQVPAHVPTPGQFFFGLLNENIDLGVLLDALVSDDKAELLATPNILTVNHEEAVIESMERYPYTEYGSDYGRSTYGTKFLDLGISLRVVPHVYTDELGTCVKMEIEPQVSYPTGSLNGVPIPMVRRSRQVTRVRDRQTLVIGGIYRSDQHNIDAGVPGLRRIPLIGNAFKHTEKVKSLTELVVFVTPTVHQTPESVTWDRMLNVTPASEVLNQFSASKAGREMRRE